MTPFPRFEPIFRCYLATVDAHYYGRRYLNRAFFDLLRERFRHRLCFVVARRGAEIVGGTANVVKGDALYGRYWARWRPVRDLHFDVCYYAAIEHCIEAGLARFEPGAGGDYKFCAASTRTRPTACTACATRGSRAPSSASSRPSAARRTPSSRS